ncbi:MAG: adenosylhomocysteinase [Fervidicoccaceae archaeon]
MRSWIKDEVLAERGRLQVEWAARKMPVLTSLTRKLAPGKPLDGAVVSACLHVTKETAVLALSLKSLGARVFLAASNPLSTQNEVAAALDKEGVVVFAKRGETLEEYKLALGLLADAGPNLVVDDGGDLHALLHSERLDVAAKIRGGTEETTTGVLRLRALEREGKLAYPVYAVNNALTKQMFDNRYGTGQSTVDGILRATNVLLAGKIVVVCGYGWVGRGIASRARGMGARVVVTEVDPVRALEAVMDGYEVMPIRRAAEIGDIFVTATGSIDVITWEEMKLMKDGAILANSGHFDVEIDVKELERRAVAKRCPREHVTEYILEDGRKLIVLAQGRLVNLVAAEGHPSEVMDMSFSNQLLALLKLWSEKHEPRIYSIPREIDEEIAREKLRSMGIEIDSLTEKQREYLRSWRL